MPFPEYSISLADLPPSVGYTGNFSHCLRITNLEKYPDYLVFVQIGQVTSDRPTSPYVLIQSSECISLNNNRSVATIAAIAKDKIKPKDLVNVRSGEAYDKLPDGMRWRTDQNLCFCKIPTFKNHSSRHPQSSHYGRCLAPMKAKR
jgi:hypothetical protein